MSSALNDTAYLPDNSHSPTRSPVRRLNEVGTPRQFPEIDVKNQISPSRVVMSKIESPGKKIESVKLPDIPED